MATFAKLIFAIYGFGNNRVPRFPQLFNSGRKPSNGQFLAGFFLRNASVPLDVRQNPISLSHFFIPLSAEFVQGPLLLRLYPRSTPALVALTFAVASVAFGLPASASENRVRRYTLQAAFSLAWV